MPKKIGLVFGGGGGKGAYEIGVWKVFEEFGVADNIKAVSGTSVGALNGALFMQGDLFTAEDLWLSMSPNEVLTPNMPQLIKGLAMVSVKNPKIVRRIKRIKTDGFFSREGLKKIIKDCLDIDFITSSPIPFYATACRLPNLEVEHFKLNDCSKERFVSVLLASSALPGAFGSEEIDGEEYIDGGIKDNTPVKPLYDEGCDLIFVVHLNQKMKKREIVNKKNYPEAKIIEIIPQKELGGVIDGTMDFTAEGAKKRISQGYEDTKRILEPIFKMVKTQAEINKKLHQIKEDEVVFRQKREEILQEREDKKNDLDNLLKSW